MYHWMHFRHAINSDRQISLLNVFGHIAMSLEIKKSLLELPACWELRMSRRKLAEEVINLKPEYV
jgi:hypothetical protein